MHSDVSSRTNIATVCFRIDWPLPIVDYRGNAFGQRLYGIVGLDYFEHVGYAVRRGREVGRRKAPALPLADVPCRQSLAPHQMPNATVGCIVTMCACREWARYRSPFVYLNHSPSRVPWLICFQIPQFLSGSPVSASEVWNQNWSHYSTASCRRGVFCYHLP